MGCPIIKMDIVLQTDPISALENELGYKFRDRKLLREALNHSSAKKNNLGDNERLEFLGDSIIGFIIAEYLYRKFPDYHEGKMTSLKSIFASSKTLYQIGKKLNLDKFILVGKGLRKQKLPPSILADSFEAIIAAVYLDGGILEAKRMFLKLLKQEFPKIPTSCENYKSLLQDYAQGNSLPLPEYNVVKESGPDNEKIFSVSVKIQGKTYGLGIGRTKKEAEQGAAKIVLESLGMVPNK